MHNLLFCDRALGHINFVTETFLLVRSSVKRKQSLCFVHGQGQEMDKNGFVDITAM